MKKTLYQSIDQDHSAGGIANALGISISIDEVAAAQETTNLAIESSGVARGRP